MTRNEAKKLTRDIMEIIRLQPHPGCPVVEAKLGCYRSLLMVEKELESVTEK